jgi:hypothetical protein
VPSLSLASPPATKQTAAGFPAFAGGPAFAYVFDFVRVFVDGVRTVAVSLRCCYPSPAIFSRWHPDFSLVLVSYIIIIMTLLLSFSQLLAFLLLIKLSF